MCIRVSCIEIMECDYIKRIMTDYLNIHFYFCSDQREMRIINTGKVS